MDTSTLYIVAGAVLVAAFAYTNLADHPDANVFTAGEAVYHETPMKAPPVQPQIVITADSFVPERGDTTQSTRERVARIYSD